jgi:hypothetical protein
LRPPGRAPIAPKCTHSRKPTRQGRGQGLRYGVTAPQGTHCHSLFIITEIVRRPGHLAPQAGRKAPRGWRTYEIASREKACRGAWTTKMDRSIHDTALKIAPGPQGATKPRCRDGDALSLLRRSKGVGSRGRFRDGLCPGLAPTSRIGGDHVPMPLHEQTWRALGAPFESGSSASSLVNYEVTNSVPK